MNRWSLNFASGIFLSCVSFAMMDHAHGQVVQFPQGEFPLTDYQRSSVELEEIMSGGPPRDGIPSIDKPEFVDTTAARDWLDDLEPVIALQLNDKARAYPLQIMMYHEIVNDTLADTPIAVTFCPLCNASIVFKRTVTKDGSTDILDFGTTGRLRNSDLVMYDRQSESWWQQFNGIGIIGKYTDVKLPVIASQIVSFGEFRHAFPDADVLSRETGHVRPYGNNPYRGYDSIDSNPFLFTGDLDPRLPPMERVLSLGDDGETYLVPLSELASTPVMNLHISNKPTVILATTNAASALDDSSIKASRTVPSAAAFDAYVDQRILHFVMDGKKVVDQQTDSEWNAFGLSTSGPLKGTQLSQVDRGVHFAFAWLAFNPKASIIQQEMLESGK